MPCSLEPTPLVEPWVHSSFLTDSLCTCSVNSYKMCPALSHTSPLTNTSSRLEPLWPHIIATVAVPPHPHPFPPWTPQGSAGSIFLQTNPIRLHHCGEPLYGFNCGAKSRLHSMANDLTSTGLPRVISCLIKYLCPQVLLVPAALEHLWCPMGLASGRCKLCRHIRPCA